MYVACGSSSMEYKKGASIELQKPWMVIPLFPGVKEEESNNFERKLPGYSKPCFPFPAAVRAPPPLADLASQQLVDSLLRSLDVDISNSGITYSIVASLHLAAQDGVRREYFKRFHKQCSGDETEAGDDDCYSAGSEKLIWSSWKKVVQKHDNNNNGLSSFEEWKSLVKCVSRHLFVIRMEHPLQNYASSVLPKLTSEKEKAEVVRTLQLQPPSQQNSEHISILALMKQIMDRFEPRPFGVFLNDDNFEEKYSHSCLPTAKLEFQPSSGLVSVIALYDITAPVDDGQHRSGRKQHQSNSITLCHFSDVDSVEERDQAARQRLGHSCSCFRCRYEVNPNHMLSPTAAVQMSDCLSLARFYMSRSNFFAAEQLYEYSLAHRPDHPDIWHARGAIALGEQNFLRANRIWQKAADEYPGIAKSHPGIALQLEKIQAYGYLDEDKKNNEPTLSPFASKTNWTSPVPGAFVADMLDQQTCQQIVNWAESLGDWTHQRHYAVPTHDVPVHTVKPLLDWFQSWMISQVRPVLAQQFSNSGGNSSSNNTATNNTVLPNSFHVHDAFCVRYRAGSTSNYLPVHTDESTHSFVLALNKDYSGGGTYFYDYNQTVRLKPGQVLSFRGDRLQHGGEAVTKGVRYILAVFLYYDSDGRKRLKRADNNGGVGEVLKSSKEHGKDFSFRFNFDSKTV